MAAISIKHTDSGETDKPAIVFLHGFPFNRSMWDEQAALCKGKFRVINYDQRGHGESGAGSGRYMFENFVDDLADLMSRLKIDRVILCGLSMGGYTALRFAERFPEKIAGLILCDTRSEADADAGKLKRAADLKFIQENGVPAFAEKFTKAVLAPSSVQNKAVFERVRVMIAGNKTEGVEGTLISLATRTDTTASLSKIKCPVLILVGEQDPVTPPAAAEAMKKQIPQATLAVIPNAGHMSNVENPAAFNTHFSEFLGGIISG